MSSLAVTGGASGIGLAVAHEGAHRGFDTVWLLDRDEEALAAATPTFDPAVEVRARACDVSSRAAVAAVAQEWTAGSPPDLVVIAAGIRHLESLADTSDEHWDQTIAVNLTGAFTVMRAAARAMHSHRRQGVIVNVASVAATRAFRDRAAYCASKAGVLGLTRAAALDLAPLGIRVIAVSPGFHSTGMSREADEAYVASQVPLGRRGDPADLAALIFDVARSPFVTGADIVVDGGALAGDHTL